MLLALLSCSDYDLGKRNEEPHDRPPLDSNGQVIDTSSTTDTLPGTDSGTVTDPGPDTDTTPQEEPPSGKIDVMLIIDVAYFYDCYHADLPVNTNALVRALFASGADVTIGIATYDDYQVDGEWFAAWGGVPYKLEQQLTTDESRLQTAAGGLELEWGGDGPGTGLEAIVQTLTGVGYDQDCDGNFDGDTDIRPFDARAGDVFGGSVTGSEVSSTPGTGTQNGVGWRENSKRIIVVLAENALRDREEGHEIPSGTCTAVGTRSAAIDDLQETETKFLGVNAYEFQDEDDTLQRQLEDLVRSSSSKIDSDGDGARDDVAVLSGSWDWPATATLVAAIWDLAEGA